ncbi:MAG: hypothetical protein R3228_16350 [Halioglobus sp.]|nr:hypothetical protein [Halioglobus sp.]
MSGVYACPQCSKKFWGDKRKCPQCGAIIRPVNWGFIRRLGILYLPVIVVVALLWRMGLDEAPEPAPDISAIRQRQPTQLEECRDILLQVERERALRKAGAGPDEQALADSANLHPRFATRKEADCRKDLQCWEENDTGKAALACTPLIELQAEHGFSWISQRDDKVLSRYWRHPGDNMCTFIGDIIEMETGNGEYQRIIYECDYDMAIGMAIEVRTDSGMLPTV